MTDQQIIGGLVTVLIMSYAAFFVWVVASIRELHSRIDRLDEKFTTKIKSLTIAVSRLEGAVYHAPPERRPAASDMA
ncbi:MAG: hypothetical protein JO189_27075 [Deltaproteobacteria bacterium]|nr:hypothetical protein [Deltaproteobacteria bacterium]